MQNVGTRGLCRVTALALGVGLCGPALAGAVETEPDDIVVTGQARPVSRQLADSAVAVLDAEDLARAAPRSLAEALRAVPGLRAEASGGEGNANLQMRGIPISAGGAKYVQIQVDGLPILEFGDIAFATADTFVRADGHLARIEVLRGGQASTFASNAPGGIINLISRTGSERGGAIEAGVGLDYGERRFAADYGGPLGEGWTFHVGGFYRQGQGPRRAGYDGNRGGQVRVNLTRNLPGGYIRLNAAWLDDRAIAYLPSPVRVTGTDADPHWQALPGLSPQGDAIQSTNLSRVLTLDGANRPATDDVRDGMRALVRSIGLEAEQALGDGWRIQERFRYAAISGRFLAPFTARVDTAQSLAADIGGSGAVPVYANGPRAGQPLAPGTLAAGVVLFDTHLGSLNNVTNDLRFSHERMLGAGRLDLFTGLHASRQTIRMDWLWTSMLLEAKGDNAALIDVRDEGSALRTDGGTVAYGAAFFGNCCRRSYAVEFASLAPYLQASWSGGQLRVDLSVRRDLGRARGSVAGNGPVRPFDVNADGTISPAEAQTTIMPAVRRPVHYDYGYTSWSAGGGYSLSPELAAFVRYSRGGRANADRFVFDGHLDLLSGALLPGARPVDFVREAEAGLHLLSGPLRLEATAFWARTEEQNYEATTQRSTARVYRAHGVELDAAWRRGGLTLAAAATWTDARIAASDVAAEVGNRPRRQAALTYRLAPSLEAGRWSLGLSLAGTTSSYAQDANLLKLPAYAVVGLYAGFRPMPRLTLSVAANNLFDTAGYTEAEEAAIPANGIVRARSINGRTVSAALRLAL